MRPRRSRGLCVVLLGADGAGKSTLARNLQRTYSERVRVYKMSVYGGSRSRLRPLRGLVRAIRAIRLAVGARLALRHGGWVLWDRHPLEDRVTRSEGRQVLPRGLFWVRYIVPGPDVILLLDAPERILCERKPGEHEAVALGRLRQAYLDIGGELDGVVVIDASTTPQEVLDSAVSTLKLLQSERV